MAAIGREAAATGNPVIPLVRALSDAVGGTAAGHVHHGATSQDIIDTAAMLVAKRALAPLLEDMAEASEAAATLAETHRGTLMAGRTLLQQALPTTFGLKAAGWMVGLDATREELTGLRRDGLYVQLGGAAGTLASLGDDGIAVLGFMAHELGLREPPMAWHTDRTSIARLAGALGSAAGAIAKPARDVVLLAQTEVGEVHEGTPGSGRLLDAAAEAEPRRRGERGGVRPTGARVGRHPARRHGARARAGRGRVARRVAAVQRAAAHGRLRGVMAARVPRRTSRWTPRACARTWT